MALHSGEQLGPYEILGAAGTGGMGEVYRARDTRLGRTVALKVLAAGIQDDPVRRRALQHEARAIAALNHSRICALYDVGNENGVDFLVMEFLEGETLAERLHRGPLPLADGLRIATEMAEGLAAAHHAGIVHRDLKPSNVMLTRSGVKLLDFGIAKQRPSRDRAATGLTTITAPGVLVGTVPYMAPEQVEGLPADTRSDVFAFGAVLYEMTTGQRAFQGEGAAVIAAIMGAPPAVPSTRRSAVPVALDRLVVACLARNPEERWQSAADLVRELRWLSADLERGPGLGTSAKQVPWRLHAIWAAAAIGIGLLAWSLRPAREARVVPPANPRPVVVLMDSPLPGRVYDPRTQATGGTNADDITDGLGNLPLVIQKENTSAMWHREGQMERMNPDLIVSHLSCLLDVRYAGSDSSLEDHLFEVATSRLLLFYGYIAASNPRTRFLVYSRHSFPDSTAERRWVAESVARMPVLHGRLHAFGVPTSPGGATFRDPRTAQLIRGRIREILGLD